ncbi:TolC family protein [Abyssalbus ytuae]|uniref:TolC family protein n=1 Tax=Abyssalbus ytuae TaxID=2926907 RepID=A0A9E7A0Z0_9FLAO|nr:TolC family protein [Abyssalbus ytuae]UOB18967.1 TolC family protein [Abyssalbus ytuae]
MKTKIISLFLVLIASIVQAQQQKKWTLRECVEFALENNISVKQFELDLLNAEIDKSDAIGDFIPSLNGQASLSSSTGLTLNPITNSYENQVLTSASFNIGSSLTLFDGLRNFNNLNRAKLNKLAGYYRLDDMKDNISLTVANAYLQILSNKETLNVIKGQYAITQQDLERTKALVDNGVVPKGDLLEIEATSATQQQQIINAQNALAISKITLAQLLTITDYENFDIADEGYVIPPSDILDKSPKEIFNKAVSFRNDIKLSETNLEMAEKDLDIAKGAYYPTLSAFFNYNTRYSDNAEYPDGSPINFTDQLWIFDGISYGLQLNVPVFNGFSVRNNVKRSKIDVQKSTLQYEQDKLDLESNINQAYVDVIGAYKTYEAAEKTVEARRLAYEYSKERFNVGLMNSFDFSQSQSRLDNAEAELIRSKYDYIFKLKVLEFYFGIPLDEL